MDKLVLYGPIFIGGIIFILGMAYVYSLEGKYVSPKVVRGTWASLGFAVAYSGALAYSTDSLTTSAAIKLLGGATICSIALLAPTKFLSSFLVALGKSPSELSNDIMSEGAISPSERVKTIKKKASQR